MSHWSARYGRGWRRVELGALSIAGVLVVALGARVGLAGNAWSILLAIPAGMLLADFLSGFAHWFADTWGTTQMPLLGKTLIRSFREHHVDPLDITRHDFVEANGNSALVTIPVLGMTSLVPITTPWGVFYSAGLIVASIALILTNQIHLWAHMARPSRVVALLQRWRVVLSSQVHRIHHIPPFVKHYCITTGWLNGFLNAIRFWRALEWIVTAFTGAIPREDDQRRAGLTPEAAQRGA